MTIPEYNPDNDLHFDFIQYLDFDKSGILRELADSHQAIANLHIQIAYLKEEEERGAQGAKVLRRQMEGTRDAYIEKKWLLKTLLEEYQCRDS